MVLRSKTVILLLFCLRLYACKKDVASALLKGEQVSYDFTNARLEDRFVNEDFLTPLTLSSSTEDETANIEALYIGDVGKISSDTVILYLHGNSPSMNDYWQLTANLANVGGQHNYGVMMFDYRGFGNSEGVSKDINTLVADVHACMDWLRSRGLSSDRLVIYGYSLGTMPAAHLATNSGILSFHKMVLEAPQTSISVMLQDATGLSLPGATVSSFEFDIPEAIQSYSQDFLWIHGTADATASYPNFKQVYDAYENPNKMSAEIEGAGHGTSEDMGFENFEKLMLEFLRK